MSRLIVLICFLLFCPAIQAQFIFQNLQKKDGLSANEVYCSYQDKEGFMWFGTANGLNRYDGSGFKLFNRLNKQTPIIRSFIVSAITGCDSNRLWIGTPGGVFLFDKIQETLTPVLSNTNTGNNNIRAENFISDNQRRIWITGAFGLYLLKAKEAVPAALLYPSLKEIDSIHIVPTATYADSLRNGMWIGTVKGLYFLYFKNGRLYSAGNNPQRLPLLDVGKIFSLAMDKKGDIWVSSEKYPLAHYTFADNRYISPVTYMKGLPQYRMFVDSKNRLWLGNYSFTIPVIDSNGVVHVLPDECIDGYKICNEVYNGISETEDGSLWIAGPNGVSKLASANYLQQIVILPANQFNSKHVTYIINDMYDAGNGNYWLCKDDGLYLYNSRTRQTKRYSLSETDLRPNRFFDIDLINGEWWCSTGDGIKILNPSTGQFRHFEYNSAFLPKHNVSCTWVHRDSKGYIWFGCWSDAVYRYDPVAKKTERIEELRSTAPSDSVLTNSLFAFENTDGKMWISNGEKGIKIYDRRTNSYYIPPEINSQVVLQACKDAENNIWLPTLGNGILKADMNGNLVDSITVNEGLPISSVYKIAIDKSGRLWTVCDEGIFYIDPKTKIVSKLAIDIGEPIHEVKGGLFLSGDTLYGFVLNKLAVINLSAVNNNRVIGSPLISGVKVFGERMPYSSLQSVINLNYNQNFFEIEFSSILHNEVASLQYAYRLRGFDKDWMYCGRRQVASYTNVPNGHYTFQVKCTGPDGKWLETTTVVAINIKSPFWKTGWFISLLCLLVFFTAWQWYRIVQKRKQKRQTEKTIDYFANSVYGENSENEICWDIARNCISQLNFEDCVVYLWDENKDRLVQKAAYGPKNPKGHEIINPIEIEIGKGIVGTVAATGKPLLVNDTTRDERYIVDDVQRFAEMAVPILHSNKVIGVIDSEHSQKGFFTENHIKTVSTIAAISANKLAEAMAENKAREKEIALLEINKLLAESQLMALRAQMNPHFVFNCLNSIQECIVTQKYGEASKYLNKFSKLFRLVLNNSGKKLVTIEEEREVLELYLELEQMRFEKLFEYELTVDDDLTEEGVLIPSMLVQPFVENALWHGLMHKEGDRKVKVAFRKKEGEIVQCIIDDNGIGRQKSAALKEGRSKAKRHESKGLAISKDRIEVLKKQGYHASLEIIDKTADHGDAAGTTVIIELSAELTP